MVTCSVACSLLFLAHRPSDTKTETVPWSNQGVAGWKAETDQLSEGKCKLELPRKGLRFWCRSLAIIDLARSQLQLPHPSGSPILIRWTMLIHLLAIGSILVLSSVW